MPKLIDNVVKIINKIFKNKNILESSQSEKFLNNVLKSGVIKEYTDVMNDKLNLKRLDDQYGEKMGKLQRNDIYNLELKSKLTEQQTLELAKNFFKTLGTNFEKKANSIIDGTNSKFDFIVEPYGNTKSNINGQSRESELKNFKEIYCPIRGDLRDLYGVVHEITHSMDLEEGETEARKIFGEIAPQCMERLLDDFLLNMSDDDMKKYGFERDTVIRDVRHRNISTFLDRKDMAFNLRNGWYKNSVTQKLEPYSFEAKSSFLRYTLAQIYSFEFMQLPSAERKEALQELMKNIQDNNMELCSKSFGIDLSNKLKMNDIFCNIAENISQNDNMIIQKETTENILEQIKLGKDFKVKVFNQDVYISLESKIPFILVTPAHIHDGQTLIMETNNMETEDKNELFLQAIGNSSDLNSMLKSSAPILIPILPSVEQKIPYYQQLSKECFQNGERPDLDIIECIDSAKKIIKNEYGKTLNDKIFLNGYSTSGVAAQRFAMIHPELIDIACIGGASGSIPVPNSDLEYPLGIKDFKQLFGKEFDEEAYKKIIFKYYVGELEPLTESSDSKGKIYPMHDMSYMERSVPIQQGIEYRNKYGEEMFNRANTIVNLLQENGYNIEHQILPNIAHNEREAKDIMKNNSNISGAQGILSVNGSIIRKLYEDMNQNKNNDKILQER